MVHYVLTCFVPLIRLLKLVRRFKKLQLLLLLAIQRASVLERNCALSWAHKLNGVLSMCCECSNVRIAAVVCCAIETAPRHVLSSVVDALKLLLFMVSIIVACSDRTCVRRSLAVFGFLAFPP